MFTREILKKTRQIEVRTNRIVAELASWPALTCVLSPRREFEPITISVSPKARPANPITGLFKNAAGISPSPWGEGRDEGGRKTNRLLKVFLGGIVLGLSCGLFGCSTAAKHPTDLPVRYHNAQYDFTFFLPADWKGYSVLIQEWNADLRSADYQKTIGTEHGPMILLRNPNWKANDPYQDIPIIVFTRKQWGFAKPQRLFVGAGGIEYEISHNAKYVFVINSRHNWGELKGWEETGKIVQQNVSVGMPHLYPGP